MGQVADDVTGVSRSYLDVIFPCVIFDYGVSIHS